MTQTRQKALEALLTARSNVEAAALSGISRSTLERWQREPKFAAELRQISRRRLDATVARLRATSGEALDVLAALLRDEAAGIRLRAAIAVLDFAARCSVDDLEARVAALEGTGAGGDAN